MKTNKKRKICSILVDRANYGRLRPVLSEIDQDKSLDQYLICAGTMVLERFGSVANIVRNDGFKVNSELFFEVEGSIPASMAKSIGLGIIEFSSEFQKINPDLVLIIGDRYEALAAAISAAYMNIPIAHIQGGEVSGSIDDSARNAITKLAHIHFPATERSKQFIANMGEDTNQIYNFGCPVGDYILNLPDDLKWDDISGGVGSKIDINKDFLLVIFHPDTLDFLNQSTFAESLISTLDDINMQTIWLWPNIDAGSDSISKTIRIFREHNKAEWLYLIKNLKPEVFQKLLKKASCAIGNSSSFVRDTTFTGTPVVLCGDRQSFRENGPNLISSSFEPDEIKKNILSQINHGRYKPNNLYGDGNASTQIVNILKSTDLKVEKIINYLNNL
jgi:UDP-hydrolysing UDP-N-acetyl-D-glucosamine 2-epimerase